MSPTNTATSTKMQLDLPRPSPPPPHPPPAFHFCSFGYAWNLYDLQAFFNNWRMSAWYILSISARNWNAQYVTVLLPRLSNMLLGSKIVQLSSATTSQCLDMQGWVLPIDGILKYNGPLHIFN
jgi:hypothetical protein